jgi:hypothetical protein
MKNGESKDKIKAYKFWRFIGRSVVVIVILIVLVKLYNAIEIPKPFQTSSSVEGVMEKIRNHEMVKVSELLEAGIIGLNSSIMKTYAPITIMINDGEITPEFNIPINTKMLFNTETTGYSFDIVAINEKGENLLTKVIGNNEFTGRMVSSYLIGKKDSTVITISVEPDVTFPKEIEDSGSSSCSGNSCGNN